MNDWFGLVIFTVFFGSITIGLLIFHSESQDRFDDILADECAETGNCKYYEKYVRERMDGSNCVTTFLNETYAVIRCG